MPLFDTHLLYRAFQYAATFDYPIWLYPQEPYLSYAGVAHDGHVATRLGLAGIPVCAETLALHKIITLVRQTGTRVHLCRISSAEGVALIRQAKAEGLPISADVGIHYLHLCDIDIGYFNSHCHVSPPLRSMRDKDALLAAVEDGTLDAICSDHAPVDDNAKQLPFAESELGTTGLELLLPLTLHWANTHNIELPQALARITHEPAKLLGLSAGYLSIGAPADICLFDPDAIWEVNASTLISQGKNTPFLGMQVPGKVMMTLVEGRVVYEATPPSI
jgi:dihydroorotase